MLSPISIVTDDKGMVIRQTANPEYGFIVLKQSRTMIQSNPNNAKSMGWLKTQNMSTLIKGKIEELQLLGYTKDTVLPGKIVVLESTTPFSEENPDQHLKIAGDTGIICCIDGEPIYRMTYYTPDVNAQDEFVVHDNVDAIRQANGASSAPNSKAIKAATAIEAFDLNSDDNTVVDEVENEVETFEL